MKSSNVVIKLQNKKEILGFFIQTDKEVHLQLNYPIFGLLSHTLNPLNLNNIKNPANLIASFLANSPISKAHTEKFSSVVFANEKPVKVLYSDETPETTKQAKIQTYFIIKNEYVLPEQYITIKTISGDLIVSPEALGMPSIDVPVDFKYTKNEQLNNILKAMKAPYDVDKKIIKVVSDNLGVLTTQNYKELTYYLNKKSRTLVSEIARNADETEIARIYYVIPFSAI